MDIMQDVIDRLNGLGFESVTADPAVEYAIGRARENILNDINCSEIPKGLKYTFIDMACGYYLHDRRAMGLIDTSSVSGGTVSSISEGDVTVSFATGNSISPDERFDALVKTLITPSQRLLARYRRLVWS